MRSVLICLGLLAGAPGAALAVDLCDDVAGLATALDEPDKAGPVDLARFDLGSDVWTGAECRRIAGLSGARDVICRWDAPLGDGTARDRFARINDDLRTCLGPRALMSRDQPVNHPDFYDQRSFQKDGMRLSVSLKDKAALQKSFVFLRLSPDIPD